MADGYGKPVTKPVPCPECGAVYSVTCKNPDGKWGEHIMYGFSDWASHSTPTLHWEVKNEAGDDVTFMEYWSEQKKFNCQAQGCNGVMEFKRDDFKKQEPTGPTR